MSTFSQTLTCAQEQWSPGIGDAHVMGWVIVGVYALCALAALTLAVRNPFQGPGAWRERVFWGGIGLVLAFLAVNKQLDLQSLMTAIGRCHAQLAGWYDDRAAVQRAFIRGLALGALVTAVALAWFLRASLRRNALAVLGFAFVLGFVVIRAIGFHNVDRLISTEWQSLRVNWILELAGLVLILIAAIPRLRRGRDSS
jgi:hypothetical protein